MAGSTHDSLRFSASALVNQMREEGIPFSYYLAANAAYMCMESLLVTFSAVQLRHKEDGLCRDVFKFFQSSLRVHVEQAFGISLNRFGVLWRPLEYDLRWSYGIVCVCALVQIIL